MKSKILWLALLALLSSAVTACASHGGGGGGGSMSLRIVQSSNSVAFFPLYVASQEGMFKKEGLSVGDPVIAGGDSKVAAALAGGSADIGGGVATTAFLLADGNRNPRIVANLVDGYYVDVIVGSSFKKPPAGATLDDKIRALKGAKIGIPAPSGGGVALMQYLFHQVGLNVQKDVTLVNLGASNAGALGALKTGRVNVLVFFQPVGQEVETKGAGSIYLSPTRGDIPGMAGQPHGLALTTASVLKKKPKAMAAFVRAIAAAEAFIHDNPTETKALFRKYQSSLDAPTVAKLLPVLENEIPTTPVLSQDGYEKAVKFHQIAGLAKRPPSYATITDNNFIGKALTK